MPCTDELLSVPPPCFMQSSSRQQLEAMVFLLGTLNSTTDWDSLRASAQELGLLCLGTGALKAKGAEIVVEGIPADLSALHCFSDQDLEAIKLLLTCELIDNI